MQEASLLVLYPELSLLLFYLVTATVVIVRQLRYFFDRQDILFAVCTFCSKSQYEHTVLSLYALAVLHLQDKLALVHLQYAPAVHVQYALAVAHFQPALESTSWNKPCPLLLLALEVEGKFGNEWHAFLPSLSLTLSSVVCLPDLPISWLALLGVVDDEHLRLAMIPETERANRETMHVINPLKITFSLEIIAPVSSNNYYQLTK